MPGTSNPPHGHVEKLDAKTRSIGVLLSRENFFRIPEYQRPFSWTTDNFDDLINDITDANFEHEYFLGTMVLHKIEAAGHLDVIDGQQRLTSLMILLACLRDLVESPEYKRPLQEKILQQKNVMDGIPERIRLEVRDRNVFNSIVVAEGGTNPKEKQESFPEPERRYLEAVTVFREKLNGFTQEQLQAIISFISQKCVVISLETGAFDDAFRLFTIVNDRGKQLRRIDILKAINIAPDVIASATVRNRLAQQWEEVEKTLGESTFESVFHLVRLILLKDKPQADLLKEFQDRILGKKNVSKGEPFPPKGEPFFALIFEYAKIYQQIFIDRDFIPTGSPNEKKYRALIHIMDAEFEASEWRACLLCFAKRFGPDSFYEFCLKLEKIYLEKWVQGVRKDERFAVYATILDAIESARQAADALNALAYNEKVIKEAVARPNIYTSGFGKYLLLRLELVAAEHDNPREFDARSIEHVLPQGPDPNCAWAKEHDLSKIGEYVDSIGNLVLLSKSKNSSAGNLEFADKKEKYLKTRVSDYPRSIQVLKYEKWPRETIEQRTMEAQEQVLADP